jgi:hypothetical protein
MREMGRRCEAISRDGTTCRAWAMSGKRFCWAHVRARSHEGEPEVWGYTDDGDPILEGDTCMWFDSAIGEAFVQTLDRDHPPWPPGVFPPDHPPSE